MIPNRLLWFAGGMAFATLLWLLAHRNRTDPAPALAAEIAQGSSAGQKSAPSLAATQKEPAIGSAIPAPSVSKNLNWGDAIKNLTPEDRKARGEREVRRVTFARIQRYLVGAPVQPEQLGRLLDLIPYKLNFNYEFGMKSRMLGLPTNGDEYERRKTSELTRLNDEIRGLVGSEYFSQIDSMRKMTDPLYSYEIVGELFARGEPLTAQQRRELNDAIARLDPTRKRWIKESPDSATGLTLLDTEVLRATEKVLSPQQRQILQEVATDRNLYREAEPPRRKEPKQ